MTAHQLAKLLLEQEDMPVQVYCGSTGRWYEVLSVEATSITIDINTD